MRLRILHYVNSNLDALRVKFAGRKHFNNLLFDEKLISPARAKQFSQFKPMWHPPEEMPSAPFYNDMWARVHQDLTTNTGTSAHALYKHAAVAPMGPPLQALVGTGAVYRLATVRDLQRLLTLRLARTHTWVAWVRGCVYGDGVGAGLGQQALLRVRQELHWAGPGRGYAGCEAQAPHYRCDITQCCSVLGSPQFTYEKRQLGYTRYAPNQWWRPGLQWPPNLEVQ